MKPVKMYKVGVVLFSKNPEWRSNGIIINETNDGNFDILTDFGNIIHVPVKEIEAYFGIPQSYFDSLAMSYPLPPIKERIQQQIDLLIAAKNTVIQLEVAKQNL